MRRKLAIAGVFASLALGCEEKSDAKTGGPAPAWEEGAESQAVGPQFEDEDFFLTAGTPRRCKKEGPMAPSGEKSRVSVPVELKAKGRREVPVSALNFTLEDAEGHEFRPTLAGCAPSIPQQSLTEGQKLVGEVAFDVPKDVGALQLRYEPFLIGRKKIVARVAVPTPEDAP